MTKTRQLSALVLGAELVALVVVLVQVAPWWARGLAAAVVLPLLARAGRPADRSIITPVLVPRFRKLTVDIVLRAYYAAGLGHPE